MSMADEAYPEERKRKKEQRRYKKGGPLRGQSKNYKKSPSQDT